MPSILPDRVCVIRTRIPVLFLVVGVRCRKSQAQSGYVRRPTRIDTEFRVNTIQRGCSSKTFSRDCSSTGKLLQLTAPDVTQRPEVDDKERRVSEPCRRCGLVGTVVVNAFVWGAMRHLNWRCTRCGHAWADPDRRDPERH